MSRKIPEIKFTSAQEIHGFRVTGVTPMPSLYAVAYEMEHMKTGAKLLYLNADDRENLFSVAFKTPPPDDTGLPHILEHCSLCGSKNYPVKDPFVELLKTSLATFLNAMTYPDKTVYPCASMNEKDFHNIIGVYCDAVFFPHISEKHFKQEGHHLDFEDPGNTSSPLVVKGIVYNEMKGVYSELNGIIGKAESETLFPDNAYGRDSGGDPDRMTGLTYEKFKEYHDRFYHPSNSYIFIYGSFDVTGTLRLLDSGYLGKFEKKNCDVHIEEQPRWTAPLTKQIKYPLPANENPENRYAVTVNFRTNSMTDTLTTLAMCLIEIYLLDNDSSPLRKALMDSRLGEALTNSGYGDFQRDTYFCTGLRNTRLEHYDKIRDLILSVCRDIADNGFEKSRMNSAFDKLEFIVREIHSSYPLVLMDRVYNCWIYGMSPLTQLEIDRELDGLKDLFRRDSGFFSRVLKENIVDNRHYSHLIFVPDKNYFSDKEASFREHMKKIKDELSGDNLIKIAEEAALLDKMQSENNSPQALATLPKLKISDIDRNVDRLPRQISNVDGRPIVYPEVFSNGICYLNLAFDMKDLDPDLLDYLPIFKSAILKMGTSRHSYSEMAELEAASTGGVSGEFSVEGTYDDPGNYEPILCISSKSIGSKLEDMLEIIRERITGCDFSDLKRLREIVLQKRSSLKGGILSSGSNYALFYAGRGQTLNMNLTEKLIGLTSIRLISRVADNFDREAPLLIEKMETIKHKLLNRNRLTSSFIGNEKDNAVYEKWFHAFCEKMSTAPFNTADAGFRNFKKASGIAFPGGVAFNSAVFPAVRGIDSHAPALLMLSLQLSYGYLWDEIRVKNGAYGVRTSYSILNGYFGFTTFRDPHIDRSYRTFSGISDHIEKHMDLSASGIEQMIIGTLKSLDRPARPENSVNISLVRYMKNITDEKRQIFRDNLLNVNAERIRQAVEDVIRPGFGKMSICTIADKHKIENSGMNFEIEEI